MTLGLCIGGLFLLVSASADWRSQRTPPLGWNSWNTFAVWNVGGTLNETSAHESADVLVQNGMVEAGYNVFSTVCTGWTGRDPVTHKLTENHTTWPGGMKGLADYLHARGMLLSVYTDVGSSNCCYEPGSNGYEALDMQTFAEWGADFVAIDYCGPPPGPTTQELYTRYADGIAKSSNPNMKMGVFDFGVENGEEWAPQLGSAAFFRITGDIGNTWHNRHTKDVPTLGITDILAAAANTKDLYKNTGTKYGSYPMYGQLTVGVAPGHPTPGDPGISLVEAQSEFSMWCMFQSALYATNDVRKRDPHIEAILLNRETIAINQDVAAIPHFLINATLPVVNQTQWARKLSNGDFALLVLNQDDVVTQKSTLVHYADFLDKPDAKWHVRDMQGKIDDGEGCTQVTLGDLAPHQTAFLRFSLVGNSCSA